MANDDDNADVDDEDVNEAASHSVMKLTIKRIWRTLNVIWDFFHLSFISL